MDISKFSIANTLYDLKDEIARNAAQSAETNATVAKADAQTALDTANESKSYVESKINELSNQKQNKPNFSREVIAWSVGSVAWGTHTACFIQLGNPYGTSVTSQLYLNKNMPYAYYSLTSPSGTNFLVTNANGIVFQQTQEANNSVIINWLD